MQVIVLGPTMREGGGAGSFTVSSQRDCPASLIRSGVANLAVRVNCSFETRLIAEIYPFHQLYSSWL